MAMSRSRAGTWLTTRSPIWIDALADLLEARDHAQRRRLAAAGGADEDHELAVGDLEVHVSHGARAVRIDLADVTERHARQMFLPG